MGRIVSNIADLWRRLTHCGVHRDLPRDDVKYIVVANVFVIVGVVLMLIYPYVNYRVGHPATRAFAVVELFMAPIFALSLYLNHRRCYLAAPNLFVLAGLTTVTIGEVLAGTGIGSDLFYIVLAIVPFLIYTRRYLRVAMIMSVAGLFLAFLSTLVLTHEPLFGGPIRNASGSFLWSLAGMYIMLIIIGYNARRITQTVEDELARERHLSEELLHNILPHRVALRLKQKELTIADQHPEVTVLFADIVDFTGLSERLSPRETVEFLNSVFSRFDHLVDGLGLEKIKTIGDAYMVAGGVPDLCVDSAGRVMELAIKMQAEAERIRTPTGAKLALRVGVNTGPVVAGVIGFKKFSYDLWGDTVNTASRMESHGMAGCVQVAEPTYQRLKDRYSFEERPPLEVKGKGPMRTWLLRPGVAAGPSNA